MDVAAPLGNVTTATCIKICPKTFLLPLGIFVFQKFLPISYV